MFSNITIKELKNYLEGFDENLPILFHSKYSGGFIFDKILLFKGIEPKHNHVNLEILDNKYYNIYYLNNKLVEDVKYLGLDVKINYFLTINEDVDLDWKWWIWMNNLSKILKNEYDITIKLSKIGDDKYKCYSYKMINNKLKLFGNTNERIGTETQALEIGLVDIIKYLIEKKDRKTHENWFVDNILEDSKNWKFNYEVLFFDDKETIINVECLQCKYKWSETISELETHKNNFICPECKNPAVKIEGRRCERVNLTFK